MSEISRSTPPVPRPAAAPANRAPTGNSEERGDTFSSLLSLVAETRTAPAADASAGEASVESNNAEADADDPVCDGSNNPVAQLLGWAEPPLTGRLPANGASGATSDPRNTPATAAAVAPDASSPDRTGVEISGMRTLATPEAIDPAALPSGASPASARVAGATERRTVQAKVADTTVALRAPATGWQPAPTPPGRAGAPGDAVRGRGAAWSNSTVSMDSGAAPAGDGVAAQAVSLTARLSGLLAGQAQADGGAPTPLLGAAPDTGTARSEGPSPADLLATPDTPPEAEPPQVSHWSTQHLRHAHLRLGEGPLDSLDIRLSMQGQDLSVDFRTDNADIRHSLAQQANQSLGSLLERSGIALADVSVGAQQRQPTGQGAGGEPPRGGVDDQAGRGAIGRAKGEATPATRPTAPPAMRADGSRPLDLFV